MMNNLIQFYFSRYSAHLSVVVVLTASVNLYRLQHILHTLHGTPAGPSNPIRFNTEILPSPELKLSSHSLHYLKIIS